MKKVLIISYYWPPGSSPGVQRWLKFVKFLSSYGWSPVVLTVKNGSFPNTDASLEMDVPKDVKVYRAPTLEPFRLYNILRGKSGKSIEVGMSNIKEPRGLLSKTANFIRSNFFIPDARIGWNLFSVKKALEIIKKEKIELILTTGPPHSTHLQGLTIKQKTGLPWIADFRDPWTNIYYNRFLKQSTRSKEKDLNYENQVLKSVDGLVVVSEGMKREFSNRTKKIEVIFNGYDPEDFIEVVQAKNQHFILAYIGNFKATQNVTAFWESLKELKDEIPGFKEHFRFEVTGNVTDVIRESWQLYGLQNQVSTFPFAPHHRAVKIMQQADLLYLPVPNIPGNKSIVTGKVFEYLASRTPILAIGPQDGDASIVLQSAKRKITLEYDDKDKIKQHIRKAYSNWENSDAGPNRTTTKEHEIYTRQALCGKMASFFDEICQPEIK